mgnify:CR=1 FL=1
MQSTSRKDGQQMDNFVVELCNMHNERLQLLFKLLVYLDFLFNYNALTMLTDAPWVSTDTKFTGDVQVMI